MPTVVQYCCCGRWYSLSWSLPSDFFSSFNAEITGRNNDNCCVDFSAPAGERWMIKNYMIISLYLFKFRLSRECFV
jgi:hypothetical protein